MKNLVIAIVSLMLSMTLGACASITIGTQQTVMIDTPMTTGAACKLTDSKNGRWYLPATPGSVTVQKGDGPMHVVCEKDGYATTAISVNEEMHGAVLGNILIGGIIGIVIDASSGAAQKYPDNLSVWMRPKEWTSPDQEIAWNTAKQQYDVSVAARRGINPALPDQPGPASATVPLPVATAAAAQPLPAPGLPLYTKETVPPGASYMGPDGRWVHTVSDRGVWPKDPAQQRGPLPHEVRAATQSTPTPAYTKDTVPLGGSYLGPDGRWVHTTSDRNVWPKP